MNKLCALGISLAAFAGCASDSSDPVEISTSALAGTVDGQPWSFQIGHTNAFLSEGETEFFASLYPAQFAPCGFSEPGGSHLLVSIPKTPGDYEMSLGLNMTFVAGEQNLIAFDGRIVVDEVTPTKVVGGLQGSYDGDNEVNGRFEVTVCPD